MKTDKPAEAEADGVAVVGAAVVPLLSDEQRAAFLQTIRDNAETNIGNVAALRAAGVTGTRGELHRLLDRLEKQGDGLRDEILEARGQNVEKAKKVLYDVAVNPDHPHWQRANALFLKVHGGPEFRDDLRRHEVTGKDGGPVHLLAGRWDLDALSVEDLEALKAIAEKARTELDAGSNGGS